jgi:hypothetical protein
VKAAVFVKVAGLVDGTALRAERLLRGGRARVLSIQCLDCGRWVKPGDWNPDTAVCEMCTFRMVRDGSAPRKFQPLDEVVWR